jgi:hypothetical protein
MPGSPDRLQQTINPGLLLAKNGLLPRPEARPPGFRRLGETPTHNGFARLGRGNETPSKSLQESGTLFSRTSDLAKGHSSPTTHGDQKAQASPDERSSKKKVRIEVPRQPGCCQFLPSPPDYLPATLGNIFFHLEEVIASHRKYGQDPFVLVGPKYPTP